MVLTTSRPSTTNSTKTPIATASNYSKSRQFTPNKKSNCMIKSTILSKNCWKTMACNLKQIWCFNPRIPAWKMKRSTRSRSIFLIAREVINQETHSISSKVKCKIIIINSISSWRMHLKSSKCVLWYKLIDNLNKRNKCKNKKLKLWNKMCNKKSKKILLIIWVMSSIMNTMTMT